MSRPFEPLTSDIFSESAFYLSLTDEVVRGTAVPYQKVSYVDDYTPGSSSDSQNEQTIPVKDTRDTIQLLVDSDNDASTGYSIGGIGADNLLIMHKWYNWKRLFYLCPVVVFDRPGYFYKSIGSKASKYFWKYKLDIKCLSSPARHRSL